MTNFEDEKNNGETKKWLAIAVGAGLFALLFYYKIDIKLTPRNLLTSAGTAGSKAAASATEQASTASAEITVSEETVLPSVGVELPIAIGELGKKLFTLGVIDSDKFDSLYSGRGGLDASSQSIIDGTNNANLKIDRQNANFILNMFWALGLANKNNILDNGPMRDPQYGGAERFASTGGWTLAKGSAMDHYSKHALINLNEEQQALVEKVSKNIYRPCCNNPTYFPDCNHGMAMLGLLELMASQGVSEEQMYKTALQVNSYWFPTTYLTLANYFKKQGVDWENVNPQEALSAKFSSASGYKQVLSEIDPVQTSGGGGCGV